MDRTQLARAAGRTAAVIRPVSPADEAVLREFFAALSVESRYLRFFAPVTPSCGLLDLMAGKPAHVDAIVAVADGVIVGHAMAADRPVPENPVPENPVPENPVPGETGTPGGPEQPRATDVGVVVADAWQRRGVGATLMRALIDRAQARGVTTLAMDVLPGNRRVLAMIVAHWPQAAVGHAPDSVDIRIPLPQPELPQPELPQPGPRPRAARPAIGPLIQPLVQPVAAAAGKALAAVGR